MLTGLLCSSLSETIIHISLTTSQGSLVISIHLNLKELGLLRKLCEWLEALSQRGFRENNIAFDINSLSCADASSCWITH